MCGAGDKIKSRQRVEERTMRVKCIVTERNSGVEWSTASTLWRAHSNYLSPLAELHCCQLERYKPPSLILHALSTFKETNQAVHL